MGRGTCGVAGVDNVDQLGRLGTLKLTLQPVQIRVPGVWVTGAIGYVLPAPCHLRGPTSVDE